MKKVICVFIILLIVLMLGGGLFYIYTKNTTKYDIPKVYFTGDISNMTNKKDERKILLRYDDGKTKFKAYTSIKVQGTSSLAYDKKNYTIKLFEDKELKDKKGVDLGWGEQNKYCLKANWIDKTHARNVVSAQLASEIQSEYDLFNTAPNNGLIDGFPVEIYINDEFLGIYTWNIPKDAWMFNMDEDNKNHIVFAGETWDDTNKFKAPATYGPWSVEVGQENEETLAKLNRLIDFVNNSTDEVFKSEFNNYLNLDSTINYIILMEFAGLVDNNCKNLLIATYDGNLWYPTLYDLDTSWGAYYDGKSTIDYKSTDYIYKNKLWTRMLENFSDEIYNRYLELRKDILTKEHVMELFNNFKSSIPDESFEKENQRWDNIPGYDYTQIEEFLNERIPVVDNFFKQLKDKTH